MPEIFTLVCLLHSEVMTDRWKTDDKSTKLLIIILFHIIYKTLQEFWKNEERETMSRSLNLEIWYVWLLGCFDIDVKKIVSPYFWKYRLFSKYRPNTDQIQTNFLGKSVSQTKIIFTDHYVITEVAWY